jgi:D-3-phosphoglycerate dehydrogenase
MNKVNTAIVIRSFNLQSEPFRKLSEKTNLVFINASGQRLKGSVLSDAIKDAEGIIAGTELYTKEILNAAPSLRVISRVGVGLDNIDLEYAKKRGIRVLNTPLAPGDAVAEHTIALIYSVMKRIPQYYENTRKGDFSIRQGLMIIGKTVGIIGLGHIGQKVARSLDALGTKIIYYDPFHKKDLPTRWRKTGNIEDLLRTADIITLHIPPQPGNKPILDESAFACCKEGVVIINTARSSLIDEPALAHALDSGIVSAAGLDVLSVEPYKGPLVNYPQVIITPHVASNTEESRQQMEIEAVENMIHTFGI